MTTINCNQKRIYSEPIIERIKLDAEISLALNSNPPAPETINKIQMPEYFNNNPVQNRAV